MSHNGDSSELAQASREAGLRYVNDAIPGFRRRRRGRGFSYYTANGQLVRDQEQRRWLEALAIPPAWQEVWISPCRSGHLLATGRDEKGRKQYIYHPRWVSARAESTYHQLQAFGAVLPGLRQRVDADLRRRGLPRERVLALVVHLLDETLIRIGNAAYAKQNKSYGLTTLRHRHLELDGSHIHLEFRGKSGQYHVADIRDRRIANIIRQCQELHGQELFQYQDPDGERRSVDSADVNAYLRAATGQPLTAKIFRTWGGSVTALQALLEMPAPESPAAAESNIRAAVAAAAKRLRNTAAICRRHYVHPLILQQYQLDGLQAYRALQAGPEQTLEPVEIALLQLLSSEQETLAASNSG